MSSPNRFDRQLPNSVSSASITSVETSYGCPPDVDLRLATYNIHGWRDTEHKDSLARIIDVLRSIDADIVSLQEVLHPYCPPADMTDSKAYFDRVKCGKGKGFNPTYLNNSDITPTPYLQLLAEALQMPYITFGLATEDGYFGAFGYGNAILSRYPIVRERVLVMRPDQRFQAGRRIEAENRCLIAATIQIGPEHFHTFCVTHLDQLSCELRVNQVKEMLQFFGPNIGPHIICGDLNTFQKSDCSTVQWQKILDDASSKGWDAPPEDAAAVAEFKTAGYTDAFYASGNHLQGTCNSFGSKQRHIDKCSMDVKTPGPTCWTVKPLLRIDYVFLSKDVDARIGQYNRIIADASDHYPIFVDMCLSSGAQTSVFPNSYSDASFRKDDTGEDTGSGSDDLPDITSNEAY